MVSEVLTIYTLSHILGFTLISCLASFAWAPLLTHFLYRYKIVRADQYDPTLSLESRKQKIHTPVMGGLLIIITVSVITILFNWNRSFTWVPIGVMLLSAVLGGVDDLLNIFGTERRSRKVSHVIRLISVHKDLWVRLWLIITFPWTLYRRTALWIGSHPGKGVHVHEKLLLQFLAGAITAWWIFSKLGSAWQEMYLPFYGTIDLGWFIVPLIIFIVMFTANAVNISDGMDGLAGGMLIPTFSALVLLSWIGGYPELAILNATAVGSLITYTYFNIKPARFQMGDVGSLGLGALLAINTIAINLIAILPLLAFMFYVEIISVIIQITGRFLFNKRVFKMAPLHHHFELKGWSEEKTVMRFWIIHLAFVVLGIWVALH